jgi:hypothetical protein
MGDIYYSTNPADYSKLEGLYVNERNPPGFIQGADTSLVGFAGKCVRGPSTPELITSPARFLEVYGGRDRTANGTGGARVGEIHAALLNKKFGAIVVRRVVAADAVKASFTLETAAGGGGVQVLRVDAANPGLWGNDVAVKISDAGDGNANHFRLTVRYLGQETVYDNLDISSTNDNTAVVLGSDVGNLITLAKLAAGRPVNSTASTDGADTTSYIALGQTGVTAFTGIAGTDGTLAVGDYNNGMNDLAVYPGVSVCLVPEIVAGSAATFHSNLVTLASQVSDRVFLTWSQVHGQSSTTEAAQVATQITTRSDRIWWCFNSPYTIDSDTSAEVQQAPHVWLASILSQISVSVHPGASSTKALLAGIKRVTATSLSRGDLIVLRNAGICALERVDDGFQFRSVVTTDLTPGKTEGKRRRVADYLQISAARRLRSFVKAKNTPVNRSTMAAELTAFSRSEMNPDAGVIEAFEIDQVSVNTPGQRAQGIEKLLWRVKPWDDILFLVFETEIGSGVVVETTA